MPERSPLPWLLPLGDAALLVRFDTQLSDAANRRAVSFAQRLRADLPRGVEEIDPNLVSVLVRYDPAETSFAALAGEIRLILGDDLDTTAALAPETHAIAVRFGGDDGPDLDAAADALGISAEAFIQRHNETQLRVLTTGFAPGFVYCGFHPDALKLPRRSTVRPPVPPGSILFAAGQTAIAATPVPTGWYVIGRTEFRNFRPDLDPPSLLREGDRIVFEVAQ
jgi:5-oxoprolinase (ATP-hydrolysing) subunit B